MVPTIMGHICTCARARVRTYVRTIGTMVRTFFGTYTCTIPGTCVPVGRTMHVHTRTSVVPLMGTCVPTRVRLGTIRVLLSTLTRRQSGRDWLDTLTAPEPGPARTTTCGTRRRGRPRPTCLLSSWNRTIFYAPNESGLLCIIRHRRFRDNLVCASTCIEYLANTRRVLASSTRMPWLWY
jgi:hypothetical protein